MALGSCGDDSPCGSCRIIRLDTARLDDGDFDIDELEALTKEGNEHVYIYPEDVRDIGRYADVYRQKNRIKCRSGYRLAYRMKVYLWHKGLKLYCSINE